MKMTSSQAAKLLRQLNEELRALLVREDSTKSFPVSLGENVESVRPEYDYAASQKAQAEAERKIRKLKHTINVFNATTVIPEFGITIDEMLVYLPQLTARCKRLCSMKDALPKYRDSGSYSRFHTIIDYRYANYDIKQAAQDYNKLSAELAKAQTALDFVNNTVEFEVEV